MKTYTVKEVIRAEKKAVRLLEQHNKINEFQDDMLDYCSVFSLTIVACCGIMFSSMTLRGETDSLGPLIVGALCTLLGTAGIARVLTLDHKQKKIREKLDEIYKSMPDDFRRRVFDEVQSRKYR